MNFCGTRITTGPAKNKSTKKSELLRMQKGMWKCEKQAIEKHNAEIRLQNKGASLTTLKTIDMSFLRKLDEHKNPVFGVFPTTTFSCCLEITTTWEGKFASLSCGLPKAIGNGYRKGFKGKQLGKSRKRYSLDAEFVGLLPQKIKDKITALREAGVATYLVANTNWERTEMKPIDPDPLVIASYRGKTYLVDVFDASIEENYVAHEFTEDPEDAQD